MRQPTKDLQEVLIESINEATDMIHSDFESITGLEIVEVALRDKDISAPSRESIYNLIKSTVEATIDAVVRDYDNTIPDVVYTDDHGCVPTKTFLYFKREHDKGHTPTMGRLGFNVNVMQFVPYGSETEKDTPFFRTRSAFDSWNKKNK